MTPFFIMTKKEIYDTSYHLKMANPHFNKGDICRLLKLDISDRNQTHSCAHGIWKANRKLGLRKGYSMK